ncbi:MAG: hypothetical protein WCP03_04020 [Candidatus Saccharibacteria bacterium]
MKHFQKINIISFVSILCGAVILTTSGLASATGGASLSMVPSSGSYKVGDSFSSTINVNSSIAVNTIEIDLNYDSNLIEYVGASITDSFGYKRNDTKAGGPVCISVATLGSNISSGQAVATITFKVKAAGTANLSYGKSANACYNGSPGTSILASANQNNEWNGVVSAGSFSLASTISPPSPTPTPTSTTKTTTPTTNTSTTVKPTQSSSTSIAPTTKTNTTGQQPSVGGASTSGYMVAIKVVDANNKPLAGIEVILDDSNKTVSDATGVASFLNIKAGKHTVKTKINGKTISQFIDVKGANSTTPQEFAVSAKSVNKSTSAVYLIAGLIVLIVLVFLGLFIWRKLKNKSGSLITGGIDSTTTGTVTTVESGTNKPTVFESPKQISPDNPLPVGTVVKPSVIDDKSDPDDYNNEAL